jgi:uncharacterized membrane protein YdfJ with MMPL/SSD domain
MRRPPRWIHHRRRWILIAFLIAIYLLGPPFIPARNSRIVETRAKEPPTAAFQIHLQQIAGEAQDPPEDRNALRARLEAEKLETDRFLIREGFQSDPRLAR